MVLAHQPAAQSVLQELHAAAAKDAGRWKDRTGSSNAAKNASGSGALIRLGEFYLSVSPQEGSLLYILARAAKARTIVEFGASFGISSIYLAAAAKDNGGNLVTTEVHPAKCAALRQTFKRAELSETATLLEGDALESLKRVPGPVDMLFLDGWKSLYLPIYEIMRPKLATGGLILADNCSHGSAGDYLAAIGSADSGCVTAISGDLAISFVNS